MKIKINNHWRELQTGHQLQTLLSEFKLEKDRGIAIAVNACVVPKVRWNEFELHENDEVIIIEAAQGG